MPSLPGPLWPGVVAPGRILSMDQIELNLVITLNWIVWNRMIYMYKNGFGINNLQWLIWHKTNPNQIFELLIDSTFRQTDFKTFKFLESFSLPHLVPGCQRVMRRKKLWWYMKNSPVLIKRLSIWGNRAYNLIPNVVRGGSFPFFIHSSSNSEWGFLWISSYFCPMERYESLFSVPSMGKLLVRLESSALVWQPD